LAETLTPILRSLLRERKITRSRISEGMIAKELAGGKNDLRTAQASFDTGNYKWATVQAYYSMFHAARALLYNKGFREKSHRGLLATLSELYPNQVSQSMLDDFEEAMRLRESADYGLVYSEEGAGNVLESATAFLDNAKKILKDPLLRLKPVRFKKKIPASKIDRFLYQAK
jgi:uncharacterized protein (UPF0332 family)